MKQLTKIFFLCLLLMPGLLASCSDDEDSAQPIRLEDEDPNVIFNNEDPAITLLAYRMEDCTYLVKGGTGRYTVQSSDEQVATAMCDGSRLTVHPVGVGRATVSIGDGAGQYYYLSVKVGYPYYQYAVIDSRVVLQGEGLSDEDQAALEKDMLNASIGPVTIGNYGFIYQNEEHTQGTLMMSAARYAFEMQERIPLDAPLSLEVSTDDGFRRQFFFQGFAHIHFGDGKNADDFYLSEPNPGVTPGTRDIDRSPKFRCFAFDQTNRYKDAYPALQQACFLQVAIEQYASVLTEPMVGGR